MRRLAARALGLFARVEPDEVISSLVMTLIVFTLMTAYYFMKTVREPLILLQAGPEIKSYMSAGQAVILIPLIKIYAEVAKRVPRMMLTAALYVFFFVCLLAFASLQRGGVKIGIAFYLWVGVFNTTGIAQFWSFANDIYAPEQGKRLFAILGVGGSLGALAGSAIAEHTIRQGPAALMMHAALLLVVCIGLYAIVDSIARRQPQRIETEADAGAAKVAAEPIREDVIPLFRRSHYLVLIAILMLLLNAVNSTGEYLLDRVLTAAAHEAAARGEDSTVYIGAFRGNFFKLVNLIGVVVQLTLVSRILKYLGLRNALLFLPVVAFTGYFVILVAPVLSLIRIAKTAENAIDYSVQTTARHALYLVTDRAEKYVGKQTIDSFVMRSGDVISAGMVWVGTRMALPTKGFAVLNLVLITAWIAVVFAIGREHKRRSASVEAKPA